MAVSIDLSSIAEHLFVITVNRDQIEHPGTKSNKFLCLFFYLFKSLIINRFCISPNYGLNT